MMIFYNNTVKNQQLEILHQSDKT